MFLGVQLEQVDAYKYLGVVLDPRLNFNAHIDRLVGKAKQRIGCISRFRKYASKSVALTLYKSLVIPLFDFNSNVILPKISCHAWILFRTMHVI